MKKLNLIACDTGAGNGRVFRVEFDGGKLCFEEVHRFCNNPVVLAGTLYWDILKIMDELSTGFRSATQRVGGTISCIGVDTWGADFGLLDSYGSMISNPVCYRDRSVKDLEKYACQIVSREELNRLNCSMTYRHCTLFRLYYLYRFRKKTADLIEKYLPISNLINYFLTGTQNVEPSMLSGSQFFNVKTKKILKDVLELFNIDSSIVPEISEAGTLIGSVNKEISGYDGFDSGSKVALVCGHDTASAATGIPMDRNPEISCFVISGTWSVVGIETENPVLEKDVMGSGYTNWCGYRGRNLLVRIFSGFYFIQECKKVWEYEDGNKISYHDLYSDVEKNPGNGAVADLESDMLLTGEKTMPERFTDYFRFTSQEFEYSRENIVIAVLRSIVLKTRQAVEDLEMYTGMMFDRLYLTGGGSRIAGFCQWLADCTGKLILSGHPEATINGNIIAQLVALGELKDIGEGRELVNKSFGEKRYYPDHNTPVNWAGLLNDR